MTDPPQNEPEGWRQPSGRENRVGIWVVVLGAALLIGVIALVLILTLATYG